MTKRFFKISLFLCLALPIKAMITSETLPNHTLPSKAPKTQKILQQARPLKVLINPKILLNKFLKKQVPELHALLNKRRFSEEEQLLLLRLSVLSDIRHLTLLSEAQTAHCKFAELQNFYKELLEELEKAFIKDPSWKKVKELAKSIGIDYLNLKFFTQVYVRLYNRYGHLSAMCMSFPEAKMPILDHREILKNLQKKQCDTLKKFFGFQEESDDSLVAVMYDLLLKEIGRKVSITSDTIQSALIFTTDETSSESE